jgi:hypothetical protein
MKKKRIIYTVFEEGKEAGLGFETEGAAEDYAEQLKKEGKDVIEGYVEV